MNTRIYKYPVDEPSVALPRGFKFLHFALDPKGIPCIWCEVDPLAETVTYQLQSVWTGHAPPATARYLGSYTDCNYLVNHLYLILP